MPVTRQPQCISGYNSRWPGSSPTQGEKGGVGSLPLGQSRACSFNDRIKRFNTVEGGGDKEEGEGEGQVVILNLKL